VRAGASAVAFQESTVLRVSDAPTSLGLPRESTPFSSNFASVAALRGNDPDSWQLCDIESAADPSSAFCRRGKRLSRDDARFADRIAPNGIDEDNGRVSIVELDEYVGRHKAGANGCDRRLVRRAGHETRKSTILGFELIARGADRAFKVRDRSIRRKSNEPVGRAVDAVHVHFGPRLDRCPRKLSAADVTSAGFRGQQGAEGGHRVKSAIPAVAKELNASLIAKDLQRLPNLRVDVAIVRIGSDKYAFSSRYVRKGKGRRERLDDVQYEVFPTTEHVLRHSSSLRFALKKSLRNHA
jgi:hypothetical protein